MIVQNQTPGIAADGVVSIGTATGAPAQPQRGQQTVNRTTLTCAWIITDDGALVMKWTRQAPADERADMTRAAA